MKKIIVLVCCIILCIIITGCGKEDNSDMSNNSETTNNSLSEIISKNNYIILDVRTKEEFDEGHVINAINIPYDEIDENVDLDKTKTILVYCRSGNRSGIAYQTLKDLGYDVLDLGAYDSVELNKE